MALLDFLKRKKEVEKLKEGKPEKVLVAKEAKKEKPASAKASAAKEGKFSYSAVREPHISEKATILGENNKYVFRVSKDANKPEIAKSIEGVYGVNVLHVKVITIPPKKRRLGRTEGFKKGYRKAVVTIKEGQKIEIF